MDIFRGKIIDADFFTSFNYSLLLHNKRKLLRTTEYFENRLFHSRMSSICLYSIDTININDMNKLYYDILGITITIYYSSTIYLYNLDIIVVNGMSKLY